MRLIAALIHRVRDERGFTMVTVMAAMTGIMLLSVAAISVAQGDLGNSARDTQTKQAFAAAEAGLNDYAYHLNQDNNYWAKCDQVPTPALVTAQAYDTPGAIPAAKWRTLPGTTSSYAIEPLAKGWKSGATPKCNTADATGSMIDGTTGTFRIRTTGRTPTRGGGYTYRSIITSFRKKGFLDFLYFTDYETKDPTLYTLDTGGQTSTPPISDFANQCGSTWWRDGRGSLTYNGSWGGQQRTAKCTEIQFADGDAINGPFHTNDSILVCGTPDFGRTSADKIETEAPDGWRANGNCSGSAPNFKGTYRPASGHLDLPTSNTAIKTNAAAAYQYVGKTTIVLKGTVMDVTNNGVTTPNVALPPNGVIYVEDGNCGYAYDPLNTEGAPAGCGNATVSGTYSKDLTISARSDIIVNGNLTKTNDSVLGLVANQFVRVAHPVTGLNPSNLTCNNASNTPKDVKIDAGILALKHSFVVDNYFCGANLGTLTVNGVIAQKYRGPVGTGSGVTSTTGYIKKYDYDDRLTLRQPPFFLNPIESSWRVARQVEQVGR